MAKSQEDEDIEKIFQKSRMTTEAPIVPIVKQEVDQEKPKELENTMYRSAKGWIETLCSAAETAGHISSELLTTVGTQKNQRRESEARAEREKAEAELRYAKARIENARALQEEIKAGLHAGCPRMLPGIFEAKYSKGVRTSVCGTAAACGSG